MKILVAFDFDDTIIAGNSDTYIDKLSPGGIIPNNIKEQFSDKCWTMYMASVFRYLYDNGITKVQLLDCLSEIPLVAGMAEVFHFLSHDTFDVIIISDSNSIFINHILEDKKLSNVVNRVFTNPAYFDANGCLMIDMYHRQDWCKMSTLNMCKGHILTEYIKDQNERNVEYSMVCYIGDGSNDLCPSTRLSSTDLVFPREGYGLMNQLAKPHLADKVTAAVKVWTTGLNILEEVQQAINIIESRLRV